MIENGSYSFAVKIGKPQNAEAAKNGTKLARGAHFRCLMSGAPISSDYIKAEGKAGRMGARLMAIVVRGERNRLYISPTPEHEAVAQNATPEWKPETAIAPDPRALWTPAYGLTTFADLFTSRQLVALATFSDLVMEVVERVKRDGIEADISDDGKPLHEEGTGLTAYAEAVAVYLAMAQDKVAEYGCTIVPWYTKEDRPKGLFARQGIPMVWDYAEVNPLGDIGGTPQRIGRHSGGSTCRVRRQPGSRCRSTTRRRPLCVC